MWTPVVRRVVLAAITCALLAQVCVVAQQYHRTDLTTDAAAVSPSAANLDPNNAARQSCELMGAGSCGNQPLVDCG